MDTALKKDIYEQLSLAWSGTAGREVTSECVVPDTMPDVGAVVDAEGVLTLRSKETEAGAVQLAASLSVSVLYMPEAGGVMRSLEITLPADIRMEAPAVEPDDRTVARLRVRAIDARALNSRKVSLRADVEAEARCYRRDSVEIASGLAEGGEAVHLLTKTANVYTVSDVREKTFVVTDEYQLPAGCGGVEAILSQRVEAVVEDVKYVSGKAVFRGRARAGLLFSAPEGRIFSGRYETEFSQIMELEAGADEAVPEVSVFLTGVYFDLPERTAESGRVAAELHLAAQAVCRQRGEVAYIADLYSNRTALAPEMAELPVLSEVRPITMRQTVTGRAEPFSGDGEVLSLSASVGGVTVEGNTVKTSVSIRLISRQADGRCALSRCRLSAEFTATELPADTELAAVTVTAADVYCAPASGGADVRATLQMDAFAMGRGVIRCVSAVTEDAEAWEREKNTPSVTLIRAGAEAELWALARRYHSTVEAIEAANEGRREGLLLIPKAR